MVAILLRARLLAQLPPSMPRDTEIPRGQLSGDAPHDSVRVRSELDSLGTYTGRPCHRGVLERARDYRHCTNPKSALFVARKAVRRSGEAVLAGAPELAHQ